VVLNNWGNKTLSLQKEQQLDVIVPSYIVAQDEPEWEEFNTQIRLCEAESTEAPSTRLVTT